jgi:site-specific recombinase XerD
MPNESRLLRRARGAPPISVSAGEQKLVQYRRKAAGPAIAYVSTLAEGPSRETMQLALRTIAKMFSEVDVFSAENPHEAPWWELTFDDVAGLRGRLQAVYAPAGANLRLSALRGVLRACAAQGRMTFEQMSQALLAAKRVGGSRELSGKALSDAELGALFAACGDDADLELRDRALLVMLYGLGMRRSEVASMTTAQVGPEAAFVHVIGKGNKERKVYVPAQAQETIRAWARKRKRETSLFGLSASGIYARLVRLGELAEVSVSPHDLRRTHVTNLLDRGIDALTVAKMVGHSHVQTTMRYDRRQETEQKRAADALTFFGTEKGDV